MDSRNGPDIRSGTMRIGLGLAALAAMFLLVACGGGDEGDESGPSVASESEVTYDGGTIRMDIEYLDTGLKGHSCVTAAEHWAVERVNVTTVTDEGSGWGVIEIPEDGDSDYITSFEVQLQELPRGEQATLTTTALFTSGVGSTVERAAVDKWPL